MTCPHCLRAQQSERTGVYDFKCLNCCVRLTMTTYPLKTLASKQLAAILRFSHAPPRETLMACVKQSWEKRHSAELSADLAKKGGSCEASR